MYERGTAVTVFLGLRFSSWIEFNTYRMLEKKIYFYDVGASCFGRLVSLASFNLFSGGPMLNFHSLNRQSLESELFHSL